MSLTSRRRRRRRRLAKAARHLVKHRCSVCRAKGWRQDRCGAMVCRECHLRVTGSWAFPDCKNYKERCRVAQVPA